MRKTSSLTAALCTLVAAWGALSAGPAVAAGLSPPVADCNAHIQLTKHYSIAQLRSALATIPADVGEYTNCKDVIQRALLAQLGALHGGPGGPGKGGGSFLPTPLIVVIAVLVVGGGAFGAFAWRRRG